MAFEELRKRNCWISTFGPCAENDLVNSTSHNHLTSLVLVLSRALVLGNSPILELCIAATRHSECPLTECWAERSEQ